MMMLTLERIVGSEKVERVKNNPAYQYAVDTFTMIAFSTPIAMANEVFIAGMDVEQSLKARGIATIVNILTARPYGKFRDYLVRVGPHLAPDWQDVEKAESMADLFSIAERIISRMPKPIVQVCGPIASNELGSLKQNLNDFNNTIISLQKQGLNVFDQMPFEDSIQKLIIKFFKTILPGH